MPLPRPGADASNPAVPPARPAPAACRSYPRRGGPRPRPRRHPRPHPADLLRRPAEHQPPQHRQLRVHPLKLGLTLHVTLTQPGVLLAQPLILSPQPGILLPELRSQLPPALVRLQRPGQAILSQASAPASATTLARTGTKHSKHHHNRQITHHARSVAPPPSRATPSRQQHLSAGIELSWPPPAHPGDHPTRGSQRSPPLRCLECAAKSPTCPSSPAETASLPLLLWRCAATTPSGTTRWATTKAAEPPTSPPRA